MSGDDNHCGDHLCLESGLPCCHGDYESCACGNCLDYLAEQEKLETEQQEILEE